MKKIILDTSIILRQPRVLGLEIPETEFLIPIDVVEELVVRTQNRGAKFDKRVDLIEKASQDGKVTILNVDTPANRQYREHFKSTKLSGADISIVSVALTLKNKGEEVFIATLDRDIEKVAHDNNIGILSENDINNLLSKFVEPQTNNDTIQKDIVSYENKEKVNFWRGIFFGAGATLIAVLIYNNLEKIISTINVWGTIAVILFAGIGLFIFREKQRLSYGVFEFLVGVVGIISLFNPNNFDFATIQFNIDFNIKLIGGLYIMVRGQDNIVKALKDKKIGLWLKDKYGIG